MLCGFYRNPVCIPLRETECRFVTERYGKRRISIKNAIKIMQNPQPVWIPKGCDHMTDAQKECILAMRMQGIGYHVIGRTLHLPENQIQLYCRSHGLAGYGMFVKENHAVWCRQHQRCQFCGAKLKQPDTGRRRQFCSGACRTRFCRMKMKYMEDET